MEKSIVLIMAGKKTQNKENKMIALSFSNRIMRSLLAGGALYIASALAASAQVKSSETMEHGTPIKQVSLAKRSRRPSEKTGV